MEEKVFSEEKIQEFKEAFKIFDTDKDGRIHIKELGKIMNGLGQYPTEFELRQMLAETTENENISMIEYLDWNVFMKIMEKMANDLETEEEIVEAFKIFDKEGNGLIAISDLKKQMIELGETMPETELEMVLKIADFDEDGYINYEEFVKFVLNH
jgi:calmodulin